MGIKRASGFAAFAGPVVLSAPLALSAATVQDEVITVTAQKQEQALQSIPISIKALSDATLEEINADSLDDIVKLVPSLSMTDISRGGNNVQIRGLGSNVASLGTVAIYNDGMISADRIQSSGTFAEQDSALFDVKRVEVLRGPQGTLYGEGSFGGVINIISNRPDTEKFQVSTSATWFDTDDGTSDNYDVAGMINVPLIKNVLAVRVVGFDYDHEGYVDAVNILPLLLGTGGPELVGEDANTEKVTGGRVLVTFTPSDAFDATVIVKTQKTEIGISSYDSPSLIGVLNDLVGTSFDEQSQVLFSSDFGSENDTDEVVIEMNLDVGFGTLTSVTGYGKVDNTNAATLDATSDAWSEELRLAGANDGPLDWIVGTYYRIADKDIDAFGTSIRDDELEQWAVFGEAYWSITPTVTATLGVRYSEDDVEVTDRLNGLPSVSESFDNVSPKLVLAWQPSDETLAYVSAAKGFRAGGANIDESAGTDPTYTAGFDSDSIWNYEIGLKQELFDGMLTVNTAVFYIDWTDIQIDKAITSIISPPFQFIVVNGEDAHSVGIEADVYIRPGAGWEIVLGGSVLEAEYDSGTIDSATAGLDIPLEGQTLPNTPEYLLNASVEKTFAIGSGGMEAFVRADYSRRDSSFADVPNDAPPGGDFESGDYDLVNVRGGVRMGIWEVQAFATNVFDEEASSFNFSDPANFADVHVLLRPRTVGLNLKINYE